VFLDSLKIRIIKLANNETIELVNKIRNIYGNKIYPISDGYFQAVAHMDYQEYFPDQEKLFYDFNMEDFGRNYDFLFFCGDAGISYYVSSYMLAILHYEELVCHPCMTCLLMVLAEERSNLFSYSEAKLIHLFLDRFIDNIDVDDELLSEAISNIEKFIK
jgi:hypothetical protein